MTPAHDFVKPRGLRQGRRIHRLAISPMRTKRRSRHRGDMRPDKAHVARPRLLIVDDHDVSRAALRALLRTEGFDVTDVSVSDEAIVVAVASCPGVAIVDVTPGRPAGFGVAARLAALPQAPVVLLTSSSNQASFGAELDGYPFLAKADLSGRAIASISLPELGARRIGPASR